ncbi:MAG: septum formation protein Maf [Pirellulales bacterium]|nr:septum formation protein Maf [Pirellulales bacterium]
MNPSPSKLILASRSPRRRGLLAEAGYVFDVAWPDESVEQGIRAALPPEDLAAELAYRKAADVVTRLARGPAAQVLVLGCDTVVACGGRIFGKPVDRDDARAMLRALRGREHRVVSGLCLWPVGGGQPVVRLDVTTLRMDALDDDQIEEYLAGGQWAGKAGAFGYQDRTGWVHILQGSESNVVGLPLGLLEDMLREMGYTPPD